MSAHELLPIVQRLDFNSKSARTRFLTGLRDHASKVGKARTKINEAAGAKDGQQLLSTLSVVGHRRDLLIQLIPEPKQTSGAGVECSLTKDGGQLSDAGTGVSVRATATSQFSADRLKTSFEDALQDYLDEKGIEEPRVILDLLFIKDTNTIHIECDAHGSQELIEDACKGVFFIPGDFKKKQVHMGFKALSKWMTFFKYDAPHLLLPLNRNISVMSQFHKWLFGRERGGLSEYEKGRAFFAEYFRAESKVDFFKEKFEAFLQQTSPSNCVINLEKARKNQDKRGEIIQLEKVDLTKRYKRLTPDSLADNAGFEKRLKRFLLKQRISEQVLSGNRGSEINESVSKALDQYEDSSVFDAYRELNGWANLLKVRRPATFDDCGYTLSALEEKTRNIKQKLQAYNKDLLEAGFTANTTLNAELEDIYEETKDEIRRALHAIGEEALTNVHNIQRNIQNVTLNPIPSDGGVIDKIDAFQSNINCLEELKEALIAALREFQEIFSGKTADAQFIDAYDAVLALLDSSYTEALVDDQLGDINAKIESAVSGLRALQEAYIENLKKEQDNFGTFLARCMEGEVCEGKPDTVARFNVDDDRAEAYVKRAQEEEPMTYTKREAKELKKRAHQLKSKIELAYVLKYSSVIGKYREQVGELVRLERHHKTLSGTFGDKVQALIEQIDSDHGDEIDAESSEGQLKQCLQAMLEEKASEEDKTTHIKTLLRTTRGLFRDEASGSVTDRSGGLDEAVDTMQCLVKTAHNFLRTATMAKLREYHDNPEDIYHHAMLNEAVLLKTPVTLSDFNSRVQAAGKSYKRMPKKFTNDLVGIRHTSGTPDQFFRYAVRKVKLYAKLSIAHIKANPMSVTSVKDKAVRELTDILSFRQLDPKWGVQIALACLDSPEVTELLQECGAKDGRRPSNIVQLFEVLKARFDSNPSDDIRRMGDNVFNIVHSPTEKLTSGFKNFVDKMLDMRDSYINTSRKKSLDKYQDPLFLKARLKLLIHVIDETGPKVQMGKSIGVKVGPKANPDIKESAFLVDDITFAINLRTLKILKKVRDAFEACVEALELREVPPEEVNTFAATRAKIAKFKAAGALHEEHYSFKSFINDIVIKVRETPSTQGRVIDAVARTLTPSTFVLEVEGKKEKGIVQAPVNATVVTRQVLDKRPPIVVNPAGDSEGLTAETVKSLQAYQKEIKELLYDLTEHTIGYISPKTIWRVITDGEPHLEQRPMFDSMDPDSKFNFLRLMYEYTVVSQLLVRNHPGTISDPEELSFLQGISPDFYTQQPWATPVLPDAKYPGHVEELTGVVTEMIRKAVNPAEPIVFSAKQLSGIMKMHHTQQSAKNGQSITKKWICATGGGKTTLAQHMADLFRKHVILASPLHVPGVRLLTAHDFNSDGDVKLTTLGSKPSVFFINARILRSIYEMSGNKLDLRGTLSIFDEFDKTDVYGELNAAVEGVSDEERTIKCDGVLKMSATSELSTMVLEQVTSTYKSKKLAFQQDSLLSSFKKLANHEELLKVFTEYFNGDQVRIATANGLLGTSHVDDIESDEERVEADWFGLMSECLQYEEEIRRKYGMSPIDRLEQSEHGDVMREFLNLLVMFKNTREGVEHYGKVSHAVSRDVFEAMTRVKRHFSDPKIHVSQVDFEVSESDTPGTTKDAKILTQFQSIVEGVLAAETSDKNVSLIEDFFLTFHDADDNSVKITQDELIRMVQGKLAPGQQCRLAFLDTDSKQVVWNITKTESVKVKDGVMNERETREYSHPIVVLYKRDEERGVDWPMSRVKHVNLASGVPTQALFSLVPTLQWMGRLRGVDTKVGENYVDLPDLNLYLEKKTLEKVARAMKVNVDLIQSCLGGADIQPGHIAQFVEILKQVPLAQYKGINSIEALEAQVRATPSEFKGLFLQSLITQYLFIEYAEQSTETVKKYIEEEEDQQFDTSLVKGYYEWAKVEKVRLLRSVLTENMFSVEKELREDLFDLFDEVMGIGKVSSSTTRLARLSKDVLKAKDIVKATTEEIVTDSRTYSKEEVLKYTRERWDKIYRHIWDGQAGRPGVPESAIESRKAVFIKLVKDKIKTASEDLGKRVQFQSKNAEMFISKLQTHAHQLLPGLFGIEATTTLMSILAQESWEKVPQFLKEKVNQEEVEWLKRVFEIYPVTTTNKARRTHVSDRMSAVAAKSVLKIVRTVETGKYRRVKYVFAPKKAGKRLDVILGEYKLAGFEVKPPSSLWFEPNNLYDGNQHDSDLWKWFQNKNRIKELLTLAGYNVSSGRAITALEMLDLKTYTEGEATTFDESEYESAATELLSIREGKRKIKVGRSAESLQEESVDGEGVAREIDLYVYHHYKAKVNKRGTYVLAKLSFNFEELKGDLKMKAIAYFKQAIKKAKHEAIVEASNMYWEYMIRRTFHYAFEKGALTKVSEQLNGRVAVLESEEDEVLATPVRAAHGGGSRFDTTKVPMTAVPVFYPSSSKGALHRSERSGARSGANNIRQLQAQVRLRISIDTYKTAQYFSIILLQLYAQLVRYDQSNINQVRMMLEKYMDHVHVALMPLLNLKEDMSVQTQWMQELARDLVNMPKIEEGTALEEQNALTTVVSDFVSRTLSARGEDEEEKGDDGSGSVGSFDSGGSFELQAPPRVVRRSSLHARLPKHPGDGIGSPMKELRPNVDEVNQVGIAEKHRRRSHVSIRSFNSKDSGATTPRLRHS